MNDDLEKRIEAAVKNPQNLGEMENADAIGTVGSRRLRRHAADVGQIQGRGRPQSDRSRDLSNLRLPDRDRGRQRRDRNAGRQNRRRSDIDVGRRSGGAVGALPPVKIHCAQLVEGALRSALGGDTASAAGHRGTDNAPTLLDSFTPTAPPQKAENRP